MEILYQVHRGLYVNLTNHRVIMTTVDTTITHEEENCCRVICREVGAEYRIRPWEE